MPIKIGDKTEAERATVPSSLDAVIAQLKTHQVTLAGSPTTTELISILADHNRVLLKLVNRLRYNS